MQVGDQIEFDKYKWRLRVKNGLLGGGFVRQAALV